jgi:crotonobetainyl-CoA:carnitine CoA-transferase CaiB-like acyl-CoA transferase
VAILADEFARRTTEQWLRLLRGAVPCGPVYTVEEALADEHAVSRDMIVNVEHPQFGRLRQVGNPIHVAGVTPRYQRAARLGEHTETILAGLGAYSPSEIADLRARGVI